MPCTCIRDGGSRSRARSREHQVDHEVERVGLVGRGLREVPQLLTVFLDRGMGTRSVAGILIAASILPLRSPPPPTPSLPHGRIEHCRPVAEGYPKCRCPTRTVSSISPRHPRHLTQRPYFNINIRSYQITIRSLCYASLYHQGHTLPWLRSRLVPLPAPDRPCSRSRLRIQVGGTIDVSQIYLRGPRYRVVVQVLRLVYPKQHISTQQ